MVLNCLSIQLWLYILFIIFIKCRDIKICSLFGPQGIEFRGYTIPQCQEVSKQLIKQIQSIHYTCTCPHCCQLMTVLVPHWNWIVVGISFCTCMCHFHNKIMGKNNRSSLPDIYCILYEFVLCTILKFWPFSLVMMLSLLFVSWCSHLGCQLQCFHCQSLSLY